MPENALSQTYGDDLSLRNELAKDVQRWNSYQALKKDLEDARANAIKAFDDAHEAEYNALKEAELYFATLYARVREHAEFVTMNSERRQLMGGIVRTSIRKRVVIKDAVELLDWAMRVPDTKVIPKGKAGKEAVLQFLREHNPDLLEVDLDSAAELAIDPTFVINLTAKNPELKPPLGAAATEYYATLPSTDTFAKLMSMIEIEVTVDSKS